MSISVRQLYEDISSDLGGLSSPAHKAKVIRAINSSLSQMSLEIDAETRIALVHDMEDTIALDAEYQYIVYTGLFYWLVRMGQRPADPRIAPVVYADTKEAWKAALTDYVVAESNAATETMGLDRS